MENTPRVNDKYRTRTMSAEVLLQVILPPNEAAGMFDTYVTVCRTYTSKSRNTLHPIVRTMRYTRAQWEQVIKFAEKEQK